MTHDTYARIEELQKRAEAAEAQVARLREALEPFAKVAETLDDDTPEEFRAEDSMSIERGIYEHEQPTIGDCRRARAALGETPADKLDRGGTMYGCVIDG